MKQYWPYSHRIIQYVQILHRNIFYAAKTSLVKVVEVRKQIFLISGLCVITKLVLFHLRCKLIQNIFPLEEYLKVNYKVQQLQSKTNLVQFLFYQNFYLHCPNRCFFTIYYSVKFFLSFYLLFSFLQSNLYSSFLVEYFEHSF